jgi:hypothetical protein
LNLVTMTKVRQRVHSSLNPLTDRGIEIDSDNQENVNQLLRVALTIVSNMSTGHEAELDY